MAITSSLFSPCCMAAMEYPASNMLTVLLVLKATLVISDLHSSSLASLSQY